MIQFAGAVCFGMVIGWFVYYINRYRKSDLQFSDITTVVGILGTGAVTLLANTTIFAGFAIGLFIGFFAYLAMLIYLVSRSKNFDLDWFLDGRRRRPAEPYYIPDGTAITERPAITAATPTQTLPQTRRDAPASAPVGDVDDGKIVHLSVVLKPGVPYDDGARFSGRGLSAAEFHARHRTDDKVIDQVVKFALENDLKVEQVDPDHHTVRLSGTYLRARQAFKPDHLAVYRDGDNEFVARSGSLSVPAEIVDQVVAVMGFDQRPAARPHLRAHANQPSANRSNAKRGNKLRANAVSGSGPAYDPLDIARLYQFPDGDGSGQTIALIELGGGYDKGQMAQYFADKNIARTGTLEDISVGAANTPNSGTPSTSNGVPFDSYDAEVQMDIEIAGSIAPAANILVYFAPNNPQGLYSAVHQAISDKRAAIISTSWGFPESTWQVKDTCALNLLFLSCQAEATICVASGDLGGTDGVEDGTLTPDFPASSPNVLACGGTSCPIGGPEAAWNDGSGHSSGGGYSARFDMPTYQYTSVQGDKRGEPDVAGNANYNARVNGQDISLSGTSAVAPLWAGLIALINQKLSRNVGFVNANFYHSKEAFTDITSGSSTSYPTTPRWDPVTGLGSPIGTKLLAALQASDRLSGVS
jgi:kumamolisin